MGNDAAKLARAARKGPPITVTCECGNRKELRYGERWNCDGCDRSYDTNKIPVDEYASIRRGQFRQLIAPAAASLVVAAVSTYLILIGRSIAVVLLVPFVGYFWSQFVRPARRRRRYQQLSELPKWEIKAD
jgi:Flp pilus assembly protein TadB